MMNFFAGIAIVLSTSMFMVTTAYALQENREGHDIGKGKRIAHRLVDKDDASSGQKIIELRDDNGLSLSFTQKIDKPVCLSKTCRPLSLIIVWDGVGDFQQLKFLENEPLTKTDHTDFSEADYEKLNRILSDRSSILGTLKKEDLIFKENKELLESGVDAYAGATQPSLYNAVVRDAVYTCYTLWHAVYGSARKKIWEILDEKANTEYLKVVFERKESNYLLWGIDYLKRHSKMYPEFYDRVIQCINSTDGTLSQKALDYFTAARLADKEVRENLIKKVNSKKQLDIIWKLSELEEVDSKSIDLLLENYEVGRMDATALGYVYKIITPEHIKETAIRKKLDIFLEDTNRYVRNSTQKVLEATVKN